VQAAALAWRPAAAVGRVPQWERVLAREPARRLAEAAAQAPARRRAEALAKVPGLALQPAQAAVPELRWAQVVVQVEGRAQESEPRPAPAEGPRAWLPGQAQVP